MNKICRQYVSEVKAFFPIMGRSEREYIEKLKKDIENYCEESEVTSKEDLYKGYGLPYETVDEYYSSAETDEIVKRIKTAKITKTIITAVIISAVAVAAVFCTIRVSKHLYARTQEVSTYDEAIEVISRGEL